MSSTRGSMVEFDIWRPFEKDQALWHGIEAASVSRGTGRHG